MDVDAFLIGISPVVVYVLVALVIGLESMGIPLPGEVILVSAALLASRHERGRVSLSGSPWPPAPGPSSVTTSQVSGRRTRWGERPVQPVGTPVSQGSQAPTTSPTPSTCSPGMACWPSSSAVSWRCFASSPGRWRGGLRMPCPRFLAANALGGLILGVRDGSPAVYSLGTVADDWLKRSSWIAGRGHRRRHRVRHDHAAAAERHAVARFAAARDRPSPPQHPSQDSTTRRPTRWHFVPGGQLQALRSTEDTCVSTVLIEMKSSLATSLYW